MLARRSIVGFLSKNARDRKQWMNTGLRLCTSTSCTPSKSQNLNNTVSAGEVSQFKVSRKRIQFLCQSTEKTHDIRQLFNEYFRLPQELLSDSLNCALFWFTRYDKIDEAFKVKALMEEHGIAKSESTYSILADLFSKSGQLESKKVFFDEMNSNGLKPQARHYVPFVEAAVERGQLRSAFDIFTEMRQQTTASIEAVETSCFRLLIRACACIEDEQLTQNVFLLLDELRKLRYLVPVGTLTSLKLWFDSQKTTAWITAWAIKSSLNQCQACQEELEQGEFHHSELRQLHLDLLSHLWKSYRCVSQVRCFTSHGNFIDHLIMAKDDIFPHSIHQFLKVSGPYDVVVDGLNIGYFSGTFDPEKVKIVVSHFLRQKKKVLVVCSKPMSLDTRKKRGHETKLSELMTFLTDHCGVFCLPDRSLDDLYFLSAVMHSGPGTYLVSCDRFVDHLNGLNPVVKGQFRRWSRLYQLHLKAIVDGKPLFEDIPQYDPAIQRKGDMWHFPSKDSNIWLCVRKAKQ